MEKYIFAGVLIIALLVLCVQIITEIIKNVITDKSKYNVIVLAVSIVLTVAAAIIASTVMEFALTWYLIFIAVVLAFFVAYGAMLGYDKLIKRVFSAAKDAINIIKEIKNEESEGKGGMAKYRSPFKEASKETCSFKKKGSWAAGYHTGVDRVSSNTALVSPANGIVQRNAYSDSYGNYVIITTNEGMSILMAHMKSKSTLKVGASIKKGDAVGIMGNTGNSSGAHLHIEVQNSKTWAYNKNLLAPNSYIDWNDTTSTGKVTSPTFKVGNTYTLTTNVKVRIGAGTNYAQKKKSQLTANGQKNALNQKMAVLKSGTKVTVQQVKNNNNEVWALVPSGWIAVYYNGNFYVE